MRKAKILLVPLTSGDIMRLRRCIYSLEHQIPVNEDGISIEYDIKIVVNTQDKNYEQEVIDEFGDKYHVEITKSDGTPGTGKNSVFDFFRSRKKRYDYLFQIDGDDLLYPGAMHEIARYILGDWDVVSFQSMDWLSTNKTDKMSHAAIIPDKLWLFSWLDNQLNLRNIPEFKYVTDPEFGKTGERIFTPGTSMFLSRKVLKDYPEIRHTNKIKLFEDYYFYLQLYRHHLEGKIRMCHVNNSYIYLYDRTNENSISTNNCFYGKTEIGLLQGYVNDHPVMKDKHPKDHLEFISQDKLDFVEIRDRIFWVRFLISKFPTTMKSLDLNKIRQEQEERMRAVVAKNPTGYNPLLMLKDLRRDG